jgi:hypothetical protein
VVPRRLVLLTALLLLSACASGLEFKPFRACFEVPVGRGNVLRHFPGLVTAASPQQSGRWRYRFVADEQPGREIEFVCKGCITTHCVRKNPQAFQLAAERRRI